MTVGRELLCKTQQLLSTPWASLAPALLTARCLLLPDLLDDFLGAEITREELE